MTSPLASVAVTLVANGYSPLPIRPGGKAPGEYGRGEWNLMRKWSRYCERQPTEFELRHWSGWPTANVGVACGLGGLIAFDIDREELVDEIKTFLPPVLVAKRGRKGETFFYRGDTKAIRSRGFKIDKLSVMDLISDGKQTVLPPSIHPDTREPYVWTTERTLLDTRLDELPEVTPEHVKAIIKVFERHGYDAAEQSRPVAPGAPIEMVDHDGGEASEFFRKINDDALANLDAWVPHIGLQNIKREGDHYRAAAEWRPSNSSKPLMHRTRHVAIHPKGIVDYGDGEKPYTAIDLVMVAFGLSQSQVDKAAVWLGNQLGYDFAPKIVLNRNRGAAKIDSAPVDTNDDPEPESDGTGMSEAEFEELARLTTPRAALPPPLAPAEPEPFESAVVTEPKSRRRGTRVIDQDGRLLQLGRTDDLPATDLVALSARFGRVATEEADDAARVIFEAMARVYAFMAGEMPDASQADASTKALPRAPYPIDMLGPLLGPAARAIAAKVQAPHEIAAQSVLAVASLAAQAMADVRLPYGQVRPLSLFALTVAQSGDRKSTADNEAMAPVRAREAEMRKDYAVEKQKHDARAAAWRAQHETIKKKKTSVGCKAAEFEQLGPEPTAPPLAILTLPDATHEGLASTMTLFPPSVGLFSDEGARLLGGHGFTAENKAATAANFSTLWDSGHLRRVRKTTGVTDIHGHRLAIHLMVQPNVAEKVAGDPELRGQGILARFLVAAPDTLAGTRFWREPSQTDEANIRNYSDRILTILDAVPDGGELEPRILEFDAEAREVWIEFVNEIELAQAAGRWLCLFRDVAGKAAEQAARIAGVLTIVEDQNATYISGDAMLRACALIRWYAAEAVRVFGKASAAATATDADVLQAWLIERGIKVVKLREITREGPSILRKTSRRREDAIGTLVEAGYLLPVKPNQWRVIADES